MHVAVNARLLLPNKLEGMGYFAYHVLSRIVKVHHDVRFTFYHDRKSSVNVLDAPNINHVVLPPQARHPILWKLWFHYALRYRLKKDKPDVFFSPEHFLVPKAKVPQVHVMHDIAYEHYPESVPPGVLAYYRKWFPKYYHLALKTLTVSRFSAQDIESHLGKKGNGINVVFNGYDSHFKPLDESQKVLVRGEYNAGNPYILYIGAIGKRKNLPRLVEAYCELIKSSEIRENLVIVGAPLNGMEDLSKAIQDFDSSGKVKFLGRISKVEDLANIMGGATAFVYPSLFEGFGVPCLEAMAAQVPVLTSSTGALQEVCGNAALYCDPTDTQDIKNKLKLILTDNQLQADLKEKGLERANDYSWDKTAQLCWDAILEASKTSK